MDEGKEGGYQPSEDEIKEAEGHLTEKETAMSEIREEVHKHYGNYPELNSDAKTWLNEHINLGSPEEMILSQIGKEKFNYIYQQLDSGLREIFKGDYQDKIENIEILPEPMAWYKEPERERRFEGKVYLLDGRQVAYFDIFFDPTKGFKFKGFDKLA